MTLEEFLQQVADAGFSQEARLAVDDGYNNLVFVTLVDVEYNDFTFLRFFRDDDIPTVIGAPGCRFAAGNAERAASVKQAKDHATARSPYPWRYECRMSVPGSYSWHQVEINRFDEIDGYELVVLEDAGVVFDRLLF